MIHKMATLAGKVIDFYDDPDFMESDKVQNLIAEGRLMRPEDLSNLPDSAFACKIAGATNLKRAFPCYNDSALALSVHYFRKAASFLPQEAVEETVTYLKQKMTDYDLVFPEDLEKLAGQTTSPEPAVIIDFMISDYLSKYATLSIKERREQSEKIFNIAKSAGKSIEDPRLLSYVVSDTFGPNLREGLQQRENFVKASSSEFLDRVWEYSKEKLAHMQAPEEVAEYLEAFDKLAIGVRLPSYMGVNLMDPIKTVSLGESPCLRKTVNKKMSEVDKEETSELPEGASSQDTPSTIVSDEIKKKLWEISQLLHKAKNSNNSFYLPKASTSAQAQMVDKIIENPVRVYSHLSKEARKWLLALHDELISRY